MTFSGSKYRTKQYLYHIFIFGKFEKVQTVFLPEESVFFKPIFCPKSYDFSKAKKTSFLAELGRSRLVIFGVV